MSRNGTQTTSKPKARNELPRKATRSPATSEPKAPTPKPRKSLVRQPGSTEGDKIAKQTTIAATSSKKPALSPTTGKNKERERELVVAKRTTPSPGASRVSKPQPSVAKKASKTKPNAVLDTYHSVTVASPPQKRRVQSKQEQESQQPPIIDNVPPAPPRNRTFTRTLDPDEVVVLKRESAKQRNEVESLKSQPVKQPVAFEVKFEEAKKPDSESDHYSDDFESYESDFETDASTPEEDEEDDPSDHEGQEEKEEDQDEQSSSEDDVEEEEPEEEESEPTHNPITVIQRDKERERKLDSGHYDMRRKPVSSHQFDSFDTSSMANSEQLDSGISTSVGLEKPQSGEANVYYGGYSGFVSHPVHSRRGDELMAKLRFDQLNYHLFEMKPLSYEGFMQNYGKLNASQTATQTMSPLMDGECQTLEVHSRSSWTQHPPHYGGQLVLSCSGDGEEDETLRNHPSDTYDMSLSRLEKLHREEQARTQQQQQQRLAKTTDVERLNAFLHKATRLMSRVLNGKSKNSPITPRQVPLQTGLLNALPVRRIFGSSETGHLVVTVHECPKESNVYKEDFASLLMVWSLGNPSQPLRLLSTWAEVCRVTFSTEAPDIVVAGLRDGSIAMWDLRETHSYCSKLDGHLTHFAATHSVVPMLEQQKQSEATTMDLGAVVDVRSFRSQHKTGGLATTAGLQAAYKEVQYASLNDSGLLTMWTLVEGSASNNTNEFSSPWARVKLLQSGICDLRNYIQRRLLKSNQSAYEKTKSLFQGNIYSDDLLRELNETQTLSNALQGQGLQGLRFTSIDTGSELIYVCTNRNFVLCCTRSLKTERFSRIAVNESRFLFPTSLCVLSNESFVAVGLSNGSVVILNCNQRQRPLQKNHQRPMAGLPPPTAEPDPETGKSCAIQNIILNERRSFDQQMSPMDRCSYDVRPDTALELLERPRRSYERRVFDQQLLLSGNGLRQHLVQALILSSDGWQLSALTNGTLRSYDFHRDREVTTGMPTDNRTKVTDIAAARGAGSDQHLLILDSTGQVQMQPLDH
ncbi:uncharacterized protein Dana_GF12274 [Drosophila ananassae]|uniref:WD repeat-containing protein 60 n=1 Tax=Drosophila ananassae TaxID=7217 RepID=B3MH62_DROAN|nr:cytoplasmic dynein 2 intermediate chain 1 [Drosophila ananassae]EDV35821.1 uncharacterized protein Dana_GF12274 [Drosophila ananassae]